MELKRATYRTEDDLKNLRIKVDLYKVSQGGGRPLVGANSYAEQEAESCIFSWQKKAFSQREFEFYSDAYNCTSALESRYNREIAKLRGEGGRQNGSLFCYVEGDQPNIPPDLLASAGVTKPHRNWPTVPSHFSPAVRRRHTARKQLPVAAVRAESLVLDRPSIEERLANRVTIPSLQAMYIMAELQHLVEGIEVWEEHLLCLVQVDGDGVVSVKPDFNAGQPPYRIETRNRDVYEYHIEQVEDSVPVDFSAQEKQLQHELLHRKAEQVSDLVGTQFTDPPEGGALSVFLFGEIVSAQGFEYNDLYVTAHLQLPEYAFTRARQRAAATLS